MCIRDRGWVSLTYLEAVEGPQRVTDNGIAIQEHIISGGRKNRPGRDTNLDTYITCLLYTSRCV